VNGFLLNFNNEHNMVDVDNVTKVDVAKANEKEVITSMPKLGDEPQGWNQKHMALEEALRIPLFERSTLSSLASTFFIMNCCQTHGTSNTFIFELLGLLKNNILPNPNTLPSLNTKCLKP
jgi:hypothetical protein